MPVRDLLSAASGAAAPADPYFYDVSLLLNGDGTNGAQNNTFLDSSSNNFTITRNGNTTQGSFSPYGNLWSNYFNGSNQYLTSPSNSAYTLGSSGDFTIDGWFYMLSDGGGIYPVVTNFNNWDTGYANRFYVGFSGNVFRWYDSTGSTAISTSSYSLNKWNYFNFTRSGSTITGYLNGTSIGTQTTNQSYTTDDVLRIAGSMGNGSYFPGYISNVRIIKGATVSGATVPTSPATAVSGTTFLSCQSNRFIDNSSNAFSLTIGNTPQVQRFSPFNPTAPYDSTTLGGSGYWNGSGDYLSAPSSSVWASGTSDFTYEAWIFQTNTSASLQSIVNFRDGGINNFEVRIDGTQPQLHWDGNLIYNGSSNLIAGQWNHLAISRNSGTMRMYLNGNSIASTTTTYNFNQYTTAYFGGYGAGGSGWAYYGYMAGVRFVNGTALYTGSTYTVPTAPPTAVANTQALLNFTNAGIPDLAMMNDLQTVGNAQVSTSVKKYGTGSMYFPSTGTNYLVAPASNVYSFGTGEFTIEMWCYMTTVAGYQFPFDSRPASGNGTSICIGNNDGTMYFSINSTTDAITASSVFTTNTWHHVAVCRSGTSTKMFLDGTQVGSTYSDTNNYSSGLAYIGTDTFAPTNSSYIYRGYIDDLRVTKGYARYTANFTPPTAALPTY